MGHSVSLGLCRSELLRGSAAEGTGLPRDKAWVGPGWFLLSVPQALQKALNPMGALLTSGQRGGKEPSWMVGLEQTGPRPLLSDPQCSFLSVGPVSRSCWAFRPQLSCWVLPTSTSCGETGTKPSGCTLAVKGGRVS